MASIGYSTGTSSAVASTVTFPLQSYSLIIRDTLLLTLTKVAFFQGWTVRKNRALQIAPNHLPYLALYFCRESYSPDGNYNAGDIKFMHDLTLGVSVIVQNNDPDAAEAKLDEAFCLITNTLWPNQYIMNLLDTRNPYEGGSGTPYNTRIEGIKGGTRRHLFGNNAGDNETPIAELQYEFTCVYRDDFPPIIPDELLEVYVTTGVKPGETEEEMAKRIQVQAKHVFTPE